MLIAPIVMPIRPVVAAVVALTSVKPKTLFFTRTGMTVPSTTRSKPSSRTAAQHSGATQRELPTLVAPLVIVVPVLRNPLWSGRLRVVHAAMRHNDFRHLVLAGS